RGTHEELLERSGRYRALHDAQFGTVPPRIGAAVTPHELVSR
ncbi:MAG: hypothetical protein K0S65_2131, partial [Labilithrix sp.]|nr:hypothetical protein [Labilithrix sp.]